MFSGKGIAKIFRARFHSARQMKDGLHLDRRKVADRDQVPSGDNRRRGLREGLSCEWLAAQLVAPFRLLALPGGRLRTERTVERADDFINMLFLDNVRRQKTQNGVVSAIDQDSLPY